MEYVYANESSTMVAISLQTQFSMATAALDSKHIQYNIHFEYNNKIIHIRKERFIIPSDLAQ